MQRKGIKKPKSPPKKRPPPSKLQFDVEPKRVDENVSPKTANKPSSSNPLETTVAPTPSPDKAAASSPPPSPFPNVTEGTNPSDWNNLSVTPQGVRKKSKKSKKKEADANGDKDTSPSRFKTNTMKPELKPIKAKVRSGYERSEATS